MPAGVSQKSRGIMSVAIGESPPPPTQNMRMWPSGKALDFVIIVSNGRTSDSLGYPWISEGMSSNLIYSTIIKVSRVRISPSAPNVLNRSPFF